MNRKLLIVTLLLTVLSTLLGTADNAVAMIAKPESMVPAFDYYPPNDLCFDQNGSYLCTSHLLPTIAPQTSPLLESDKSKQEAKNGNFEEVNKYPW